MPSGVYKRTEDHNKKNSESKTGMTFSKKHKENMSRAKSGPNHPNWKGGQKKDSHGYFLIWKPDHPRADKKGYVKRARLVAEEILGRYLYPDEIAHHKNEIKDDDRPENIEIKKSRSAHTKYHRNL